eukprot:14552538-Alexandrium_andersonii.AAC.1
MSSLAREAAHGARLAGTRRRLISLGARLPLLAALALLGLAERSSWRAWARAAGARSGSLAP